MYVCIYIYIYVYIYIYIHMYVAIICISDGPAGGRKSGQIGSPGPEAARAGDNNTICVYIYI